MYPYMPNATGIFVAQVVFLCGLGLGGPAINALVAIAGREIGTGTTISALQSANSVGNILGPLAAGMLLEYVGFATIFNIGGIILLLSVSMFFMLTRGFSKDTFENPKQ